MCDLLPRLGAQRLILQDAKYTFMSFAEQAYYLYERYLDTPFPHIEAQQTHIMEKLRDSYLNYQRCKRTIAGDHYYISHISDLVAYISTPHHPVWPPSQVMNLCNASQSLRREYDSYILYHDNFIFTCPSTLAIFFKELSPAQLPHRQRVTIVIYNTCRRCAHKISDERYWVEIADELPPKLDFL